MKTIEQVVEEDWFKLKPFLVIGTGKSLERWDDSLKEKYNIWTINSAIEVTKYADIAAIHDGRGLGSNWNTVNSVDFSARYILTRSSNSSAPVRSLFTCPLNTRRVAQRRKNTIYVNLACDDYDAINYPDQFKLVKPFGEVFPCQNSSSLAFCIFSHYHKKDVYTLGINDGDSIAEGVNENYKRENKNTNWPLENKGMEYWSKGKFKIHKL